MKVVCDWDECLQPLKAAAIYKFYKGSSSFQEFFKIFWENAVLEGSFSSGGKINISLEGKDEKEAIEKYMKMRKTMRKSPKEYAKSFYGSPERWETPLTSIGKDLLTALKENSINRLIIISSYRKDAPSAIGEKRRKIERTFSKFPVTEIELTEVGKTPEGKYKPYRWEVLQDKYPDWDIFIDDNPNIITETIKNIPDKNKIYVLPDYKTCQRVQGDNVYHVKTTVSDLKDEDFIKAAEEYKAKKKQERKDWAEKAMKKSIWKQPSTYLAFISGVSLTLLVVFLLMVVRRKRKRKKF